MKDVILAMKLYKCLNGKDPSKIIIDRQTSNEIIMEDSVEWDRSKKQFSLFGIPITVENRNMKTCMCV